MPRDINGVYTLPLPPRENGTDLVSSTWANTTLADIAAALTASVAMPGSATPEQFDDDELGFQQKMGIDTIVANLEQSLAFLESCQDAEVGDMEPFAMVDIDPDYFLVCDGGEYDRTEYAELFAVIGTTWGEGDGSTTFNVPDLRAEWVKTASTLRAPGTWEDGAVMAHTHTGTLATGGAHSHTGTTASAGAHTHSASTASAGGHTHTGSGTSGNQSADHVHNYSATSSSAGAHSHTVSFSRSDANSSGSRGWVDNLTSGSGKNSSSAGAHTHGVGGTTGSSGAHTHPLSGTSSASGGHNHTVTFATAGEHSHGFTTSENGAHAHTVTIDSTGAEGRMANITVQYCIRYKGV